MGSVNVLILCLVEVLDFSSDELLKICRFMILVSLFSPLNYLTCQNSNFNVIHFRDKRGCFWWVGRVGWVAKKFLCLRYNNLLKILRFKILVYLFAFYFPIAKHINFDGCLLRINLIVFWWMVLL